MCHCCLLREIPNIGSTEKEGVGQTLGPAASEWAPRGSATWKAAGAAPNPCSRSLPLGVLSTRLRTGRPSCCLGTALLTWAPKAPALLTAGTAPSLLLKPVGSPAPRTHSHHPRRRQIQKGAQQTLATEKERAVRCDLPFEVPRHPGEKDALWEARGRAGAGGGKAHLTVDHDVPISLQIMSHPYGCRDNNGDK